MRLAVFTKNLTNPAYCAARLGAERAAAALGGVEVLHFVPQTPDDPAQQSALIDEALVAASPDEFAPLARAMAEVMGHCDGFFPTDFFLYWRARVLAAARRLEVQGDPTAGYRDLQVRRVMR